MLSFFNKNNIAACHPVKMQLARGVLGLSLLGAAALLFNPYPAIAILALLGALVSFKGCPGCWTVGMIEALRKRAPK